MKNWTRAAWLGCVAITACSIEAPNPAAVTYRGLHPADSDQSEPASESSPESAAKVYALAHIVGGALSRMDLQTLSSRVGQDGLTHVRLQQTLDGIKVFGGDVVVHAVDGKIAGMGGNVGLDLDKVDTKPTVTSEAAMATAKHDFVGGDVGSFVFEREASELTVLAREGEEPRLAWQTKFYNEQQNGKDPAYWNYFVDAKTGVVLQKFNAIHTLSQASGPGGNAKTARTWTNALDVEASGSSYKMDTTKFRTVNMNSSTTGSGTIVTGPLSPISDAPIDDAHGFAEVTVNMMQDWMGYNSIDNAGFKIISRVHYGSRYENAYWDGTQMTYGDGANTFYPLSGALDVAAHEINHGFTSFHSNLTYSGMSGGMNESFSDVAGTIAEFYYEGTGADFDLGKEIFKSTTGALRYMCNPTQDGASIDNAARYTSSLDVHYSSGVFNKAFCMAARRLTNGTTSGTATPAAVRRAGKAWYEANDNYWTASSTFTQGCTGVLAAATALGYTTTEYAALRNAFIDVGVTCGTAGGGGGGGTTGGGTTGGGTTGGGTTGGGTTGGGTTTGGGGGSCVSGRYAAAGLPVTIPDNNSTGVTSTITVPGTAKVGSATVDINIAHSYRGDLVVDLIAPDGTSYSVTNRSGGSADNVVFTAEPLDGAAGNVGGGTWKLVAKDLARIDVGSIKSWSLNFTGCN